MLRLSAMESGHGQSNVTYISNIKESKALTPYENTLKQLRASPSNKITFSLRSEKLAGLSEFEHNVADLLIDELKLWSDVLGERNICAFILSQPFKYFEPFELTRVMHTLASQFSIDGSTHSPHLALLNTQEINQDNLALLKGLGINQLQLIVDQQDGQNIERLCDRIAALRAFKFDCLGVQLSHTDCLDDIREFILQIQKKCSLDYLCTGSENDLFDLFANDKRMKTLDTQKHNDVLEIGIESNSKFNDHFLKGYGTPNRYISALKLQNLPIHS